MRKWLFLLRSNGSPYHPFTAKICLGGMSLMFIKKSEIEDYSLELEADSTTSYVKSMVSGKVSVVDCYKIDVLYPESVEACINEETSFDITLENTGLKEDTYTIQIEDFICIKVDHYSDKIIHRIFLILNISVSFFPLFHQMKKGKLRDPAKIIMVLDHYVPCPNDKVARLHDAMRRFCNATNCTHSI